jgi:antirestriction protein ArdC
LEQAGEWDAVKLDESEKMSFEPMDVMIRDNRWICPIKPMHQDKAYFSISKNEIVVPEKSQFKDGESYYGTLWHEMTHSTGIEGQLDVSNRPVSVRTNTPVRNWWQN